MKMIDFTTTLKKFFSVFLFLSSIGIFSEIQAQSYNETQVIFSSDRNNDSSRDYLGRAVDIHGEYAILSADNGDYNGQENGFANIYKFDSSNQIWNLQKSILSSLSGNRYAANVAIEGTVAAVRDGDHGVFIYYKDQGGIDNWGEIKVLPIPGFIEVFRNEMFIWQNYLVVGSQTNSDLASENGTVYIFEKDFGGTDNWGLVKQLYAPDAGAGDQFGVSASMHEDLLIVGAWNDQDNGTNSGSAYIFNRDLGGINNWGLVKKLLPNDGSSVDIFGGDVSIHNEFAVVGAPQEGSITTFNGAAYIFDKDHGGIDNWGQIKKILGPSPSNSDHTGSQVAIEDNYVFVGSSGDDPEGSIFIYEKDEGGSKNFGLVQTLNASSIDSKSVFDSELAIAFPYILVGSDNDREKGSNAGAGYMFEFDVTQNQWNQRQKIIREDGAAFDLFASSISLQKDILVVGSPMSEAPFVQDAGAVYVFEKNSQGLFDSSIKLVLANPDTDEEFGASVDVCDDVIAVGTPKSDAFGTDSGVVYIFKRDQTNPANWLQLMRINSSTRSAGDNFGYSVSLQENLLLVGAVNEDTHGTNSGSAFIFQLNLTSSNPSWQELAQLIPPDGASQDLIGYSVSLDGDYAYVGAPNHDPGPSNAGSVYCFEKDLDGINNWGFYNKIFSSNPVANDFFGSALDVENNRIMVGAFGDDEIDINAGAAYFFENIGGPSNQINELQKVFASNAARSDAFGYSVSISCHAATIGALNKDDHGSNSGAAYVFKNSSSGWEESLKLSSRSLATGDHFGSSIDVFNNTIIVGAEESELGGRDAGAAYIIDIESLDSLSTTSLPACVETSLSVCSDSGTATIIDQLGSIASVQWDSNTGNQTGLIATELLGGIYSATVTELSGNTYVLTASIESQSTQLKDKITLSEPSAVDYFGKSIDMDSKWAIIGAPGDDDVNTNSGAAYVYEYVNGEWIQFQKLKASDASISAEFGATVAIDNELIAIAALKFGGSESSKVYIFRFDGSQWVEEQIVYAVLNGNPDWFGQAIDINGDIIAVGRPIINQSSGDIYIYKYDGAIWQQQAILVPNNLPIYSRLGSSLSLSENNILVAGAYQSSFNGSNYVGSVYAYQLNGNSWDFIERVVPSDYAASDRFGDEVSLRNGRLIASSTGDDDNGSYSGSVYVFEFDGTSFLEKQKLLASNGFTDDFFGSKLSQNENFILITSSGADNAGLDQGAVYVFAHNGTSWNEREILVPDDIEDNDRFGNSIGIFDSSKILIGSYDDDTGTNSGSVYYYDFPNFSGDDDFDGICNDIDNCIQSYNPSQLDSDQDGFGDACCTDFAVITESYIASDSIKVEVKDYIEASNLIDSGADIIYDARSYILLGNEFEVKQSAVFHAYIDGCGNI